LLDLRAARQHTSILLKETAISSNGFFKRNKRLMLRLDDSQPERMCHSKLSSSYLLATTTHFKPNAYWIGSFPQGSG